MTSSVLYPSKYVFISCLQRLNISLPIVMFFPVNLLTFDISTTTTTTRIGQIQ
jgi:hypothetical protein